MSLKFWEEVHGSDENLRIIRLQMIFKAMVFEEILKIVSIPTQARHPSTEP